MFSYLKNVLWWKLMLAIIYKVFKFEYVICEIKMK